MKFFHRNRKKTWKRNRISIYNINSLIAIFSPENIDLGLTYFETYLRLPQVRLIFVLVSNVLTFFKNENCSMFNNYNEKYLKANALSIFLLHGTKAATAKVLLSYY